MHKIDKFYRKQLGVLLKKKRAVDVVNPGMVLHKFLREGGLEMGEIANCLRESDRIAKFLREVGKVANF